MSGNLLSLFEIYLLFQRLWSCKSVTLKFNGRERLIFHNQTRQKKKKIASQIFMIEWTENVDEGLRSPKIISWKDAKSV